MEFTKEQDMELRKFAQMDIPGLERQIAPYILTPKQKNEVFNKIVESMRSRNRQVDAKDLNSLLKQEIDSESLLGEYIHKYLDDLVRRWVEDYVPKYKVKICEKLKRINYKSSV